MDPNSKILALAIHPQPEGAELFECDLESEENVIKLFDSCQILETIIYDKGWNFLLLKYGLIKLYQIDLKSGWFDTEDKKDWLSSLLYHCLISGFNAQTGSFGTYNEQNGTFITPEDCVEAVDWEKFKARAYLLEYED